MIVSLIRKETRRRAPSDFPLTENGAFCKGTRHRALTGGRSAQQCREATAGPLAGVSFVMNLIPQLRRALLLFVLALAPVGLLGAADPVSELAGFSVFGKVDL